MIFSGGCRFSRPLWEKPDSGISRKRRVTDKTRTIDGVKNLFVMCMHSFSVSKIVLLLILVSGEKVLNDFAGDKNVVSYS